MNHGKAVRNIILMIAFSTLLIAITPVLAAPRPYINVSAVVHPQTTLDSLDVNGNMVFDAGDDFRYVDVQIYAQGNVQFWAVDMACTFTQTALTSYNENDGNLDPGDDNPMVMWGPAWDVGTSNPDYTSIPFDAAAVASIASTGRIQLNASRLGKAPRNCAVE